MEIWTSFTFNESHDIILRQIPITSKNPSSITFSDILPESARAPLTNEETSRARLAATRLAKPFELIANPSSEFRQK